MLDYDDMTTKELKEKETVRTNDLLLELNNRVGVMISLLLRMVQQDKSSISLKDQIQILNNLGLRPRDIAAILGKTPTHISKELVGIRKTKTTATEE